MARIRCFLVVPTERVRVSLRRYSRENTPDCCSLYPGKYSYHTTMVFLREEEARRDEQGALINGLGPTLPRDDPRWPRRCGCGYTFTEADTYQHFDELLYRRADSGEEMTLRDVPAGAMWEAPWLDRFHRPQGAHSLIVKLPDGSDWAVDGPANNCNWPGGDARQGLHHCWPRRGAPPDVDVSKEHGPTCTAGAGSIMTAHWHGFLRNGYLEG